MFHEVGMARLLVIVRKYYLCSWRNAPRINHSELSDQSENMRKGDRRQAGLEELRKSAVTFSGHKQFSRRSL
jgi:hypothetical protein